MFVFGNPCEPSLLLKSEDGVYLGGVHIRCSSLGLVPILIHKHWAKLERLVGDKHSNLICAFLNYRLKKFLGPELCSYLQMLDNAEKACRG
jgi:hypothetical protein